MAVKFNTLGLSDNLANTYTLEKFNGVDYTSTPTLVDDSRAIEISNYVPFGNSLIKRNGWEQINKLEYNGKQLRVHNIWKFKNYFDSDEANAKYVFFATSGLSAGNDTALYVTTSLLDENENYKIERVYPTESINSTEYSYGIIFENRLFVLAMGKYLMFWYEEKENEDGTKSYELKCDEVKKHAFIPTVMIGLGHTLGEEKPSTLQEFNLLSNKCYVEIINYSPAETEKTYIYDISSLGKKITSLISIDGISFVEGEEMEGIGNVSLDKEKGLITLKKASGEARDSFETHKVLLEFENDSSIVEKMQFGIAYGSYGYRDRLFLSGNPQYPNMDIHTAEAGSGIDNWLDYTYFGDLSFHAFGHSAQRITGYGIMDNGYMAIFKEMVANEPNLYLRTYEMVENEDGIYVERFPTTVSGISVASDTIGQVINYGNDLLINIPKGIYKINTAISTATQKYEAKEMSYFIRHDLGEDMSESATIVFDNKLYVCRKDYKGVKRLYVADSDRYSVMDGTRIYEWWVLDNVNATKFYIFNNELYFTDNKYGLCKFSNSYFDSYVVKIGDVKIGEIYQTSGVFLNVGENTLTLPTTSEVLTEIHELENVEKSYKDFKEYGQVSFGNSTLVKITSLQNNDGNYKPIIYERNESEDIIKISIDSKDERLLEYALINNFNIVTNNDGAINVWQVNDFHDVQIDGVVYGQVSVTLLSTTDYPLTEFEIGVIIPAYTKFSVREMYTKIFENGVEKYIPLSKSYSSDNVWYYEDGSLIRNIKSLGSTDQVFFNMLDLKLYQLEDRIDIELYDTPVLNNVYFYMQQPVSSYWKSKYHDLGKLEYLKTISHLTFVPETKRGGMTYVGYRTLKNEVEYFTQAESEDFNFNAIDFDNFSFGGSNMAKTYSSKRKIKNFSFVQFKFYSEDANDSTMVSLVVRYKYTKLNKGVK